MLHFFDYLGNKFNITEKCVDSDWSVRLSLHLIISSISISFLLGRSVMLEQPRKTGNKIISHMLSSHGGEIYIHVLSTWRSMLEDPPSISEGAGGRLTDYRINVRLLVLYLLMHVKILCCWRFCAGWHIRVMHILSISSDSEWFLRRGFM